MIRLGKRIRLALAALLVAGCLVMAPDLASAHPPIYRSTTYYYAPPPAVYHYGPATVHYLPTVSSYYSPPVTVVQTPGANIYYNTNSYSFYQGPRVVYQAPAPVYYPPAYATTTTTFYRRGLILPRARVYQRTTTYYTPGYFRY